MFCIHLNATQKFPLIYSRWSSRVSCTENNVASLQISPNAQTWSIYFTSLTNSAVIHCFPNQTNYLLFCFPIPHANIQFVPDNYFILYIRFIYFHLYCFLDPTTMTSYFILFCCNWPLIFILPPIFPASLCSSHFSLCKLL